MYIVKFPVAFKLESDRFSFLVPDVKGCEDVVSSLDDIPDRAKDMIGFCMDEFYGVKDTLPTPSRLSDLYQQYSEYNWILIEVDMAPFVGAMVKINVTLPANILKSVDLCVEHSPYYKNRSHFLDVAARYELDNRDTRRTKEKNDFKFEQELQFSESKFCMSIWSLDKSGQKVYPYKGERGDKKGLYSVNFTNDTKQFEAYTEEQLIRAVEDGNFDNKGTIRMLPLNYKAGAERNAYAPAFYLGNSIK